LCFISQGTVKTAVRRRGQFYRSFVANFLQYLCAKNYQNTMRFDKIIAKITRNLSIANRSRVSCAHNTSMAVTP